MLYHQGRQSGRMYATPLGMRPLGNAFLMPRTFGKNAAWYLNVKAAGWCVITYKGRDYRLIDPEVVDYATAAPAFPCYELLQFRLVGINEYLRMTQSPQQFEAEKEQSPMSQASIADTISAPRNLGLALIVIAFAQLMVVLDTTIVNVALPSIQRALRFSSTDLEWVVNAYSLAFGGLLLLGGRAGDLFGRRRMFVGGVLLFAAGSFAGGLATSSTWLIIARVVQGAGAAVVAPTALSLIADTFKEGAARNRALGIYAGAAGSGGAVGLILGGLITNYVSWRWVMFVNVPIALLLAVAAPRVLAMSQGRSGRLDLPGAISVTGGMTLLVYGLSRAATHDWSDTITVAALGFGAALLVLFLIIELRSKQPLVPLSLFVNGNRSGAYALRMVAGAMTLTVLFFLTQIVQNVLGYSPSRPDSRSCRWASASSSRRRSPLVSSAGSARACRSPSARSWSRAACCGCRGSAITPRTFPTSSARWPFFRSASASSSCRRLWLRCRVRPSTRGASPQRCSTSASSSAARSASRCLARWPPK